MILLVLLLRALAIMTSRFFGDCGVLMMEPNEWVAVRKEDLRLLPENVDDVSAAGIPVAYLTAQARLICHRQSEDRSAMR